MDADAGSGPIPAHTLSVAGHQQGQLAIVNSSTSRTAVITHAKHDMFFMEVRDERGQVIHFDPYSPSVSEALRVARKMTASDWLSWAALAQTRKRAVSLSTEMTSD
jgi:hypothetical protein